MTDLLTRLEQAESGSYALDMEIFGFVWADMPFPKPEGAPPAYTTSLDAALTLVPEGWHWGIGGDINYAWVGIHTAHDKITKHEAEAATPALALCIAALRARG